MYKPLVPNITKSIDETPVVKLRLKDIIFKTRGVLKKNFQINM